MKIMIVGGTGFLGYHSLLEARRRGYKVNALAIDDVELGDWYPGEVNVGFGDVLYYRKMIFKDISRATIR